MDTAGKGTYEQPRHYGRIRLDELASGEMISMLQERLDWLDRSEPTRENRSRRNIAARVLAEVLRMREECGWDG